MKKFISTYLMLMMIMAAPAFAASTNHVMTASADVQGGVSLSVDLWKQICSPACDDFGEDIVNDASMDFTTLTENNGQLSSPYAVMAYITMNNQQAGVYTLSQNATALSNGVDTIPNSSFTVGMAKILSDNGGLDQGSILTGTQSAVQNLTLYTSNGANSIYTVRGYYGVSGVPIDQPAGTYNSTVTITLTG